MGTGIFKGEARRLAAARREDRKNNDWERTAHPGQGSKVEVRRPIAGIREPD
jgi:hypothetical protein